MEYPTCSAFTSGPLSAAAQRIMAALRAQYAGRIDRNSHIADSFGRAFRLSQNQGTFNKSPEPHTQAKIYVRESVANLPKPDLVVKNNYNTMSQPHEDSERHLFKHTPEMEFAFDYGDVGILSGCNSGNNIPGLCRTPPEPYPQGDQPFPRTGFINRGKPQAVMGLPQPHSETSGRKERNQLLASCEEDWEAESVTPRVKRWRFGNLQIPIITCSKQFEENGVVQTCELGKANENPDKVPFTSIEKRTEITKETEVDQNCYEERTERFEFTSVLFKGVTQSRCGKVCKNGQNDLKEMPIPAREIKKMCPILADPRHDSATNTSLNNGSHLSDHHTRVSVSTRDFDQYTEVKQKASMLEREPARLEHVHHSADLFMRQSDMKNDQLETQECNMEPEHSAAQKDAETHHNRCEISQESCSNQTSGISGGTTAQLLHQAKQRNAIRRFINPLKRTFRERTKPAQKRLPASEGKEQIYPEKDKTSETSKPTLALISDPRVCDTSRLSQGDRVCVLEEAVRARALVLTMVYQDGTTQLDPEQKHPPAVCGVLVLLKKSLDSLVLEEIVAAEEKLLFLRLEQRPVWAQQDSQHNQDVFTREILMKMMCGTQTLVCYKSKDLLRTALRHFSKDLSWKQVAGCQVMDPQIAAWLLDPADSATCFQDLFNKYCTRPAAHTSAQAELRHQKVNHVISSLSRLHRVMVELRNKLEIKGLWRLYFCMEERMIPVLAAMESHRIHVDRDALKKTSEMLGVKMKQLEQEAHQTAGQKFLLSSSSQLRLVLFEKLRLHERCENKRLPKTLLKQQQSTSEAVLLQLQDLHPLPKIILEYRQLHKIKSTFLDGILSCMTKTFVSSTWNQTSTVSGRLSAKHPNFQALPRQPVQIWKKQCVEGKDTELVPVHPRAMFIPQEGWTFLSADFCQVELRLLAHLSSDPELLRIFQNPDADVFNMLASQWKGVGEDSVSAEDREHAKRIVYSVVYGAGKERLSGILGVSAEEASHFQDSFLQKYKEVQAFIQCTVQRCHKYGYVKSIMGRHRSLPHIRSTDWAIRNQAERQAVNFVVQGSAADLCKMAMIHICSHVASSTTLTARLVAQIHDELLFEVEDSQVEDFAVLVKKTMESLQHISCLGVSLTVPLKVSVSTGRSWGSMCEVHLPRAAPTHTSV